MRIPSLGETELLVPLHEGVFEQPMWQTFLKRLRDMTGAASATMMFRPPDSRKAVQFTSGTEREAARFDELFAERYGIDPLQARYMREGRVYTLDELIEAGERLENTEVHEAQNLAPVDLAHMRAMRLSERGEFDAWLIVSGQEPFGAEVGNLFSALTPHLRVALRVLGALERERARASMNADAFNRMNFGWISIDARCHIIDMNGQAERMLQQSGALRRGQYDRLTPSSPAVDRQLTSLVRRYAEDPHARPRAINLSQDPWIDILVSPLRLQALSGDTRAVAVLYFRGDRSSTADRCDQLCDVFDLTPSEARLAWSMTQGMSITEAAEACGITVETARNYSKKIYAKTGARGQVDLVRHILTGVLAIA